MDSMNLVSYIEDERLFDYAASCAQTLRPDALLDGRGEASTLRRSFQEIERCHDLFRRRYQDAPRVPAACEWLLDNDYMIRREYPPVRRALRDAERQRACRGKLLTLELCRALLQAGNGRVSEERCLLFLKGFQSVTVLRRRELLLFPAALRAALLEAVAMQCQKLCASSEPETLSEAMAALFGSLNLLSTMDMERVLDESDVPAAVLSGDPDGSFSRMDRLTREDYLRRLADMAEAQDLDEQALARTRERRPHLLD